MGFKFRKRIKVIPGVTLNIGKKGISTSIGKSGATINVSKKGVKGTVGVPGSGVSFTQDLTKKGLTGKGEAEGVVLGGEEGSVIPWEDFCKLPFEARKKYLETGGKVGKRPFSEKLSFFILALLFASIILLII